MLFVVLLIVAVAALLLPTGGSVRALPQESPRLPDLSAPIAASGAASGLPEASSSTGPTDPSALTGYAWPLAKSRVTLPFGATDWGTWRVDGELFHDGVDIASFCGDYVLAAHDGTVLAAGVHFDDYLGWQGDLSRYYHRNDQKRLWDDLPITVVIDDGNGYRSIYAHFYELTVKVGQKVKAGEMIGYEGMSGHATGCHLHYGLFSPLEAATIPLDPAIASHMLLPPTETARVNPLLVLPFRWDVEEMQGIRTPPPGSTPPPTPTPKPSATPGASPR